MAKLNRQYALESAKFKVGDIIKDLRWTFKVDRITYSSSSMFKFPVPIYEGFELKKDLTPRKDKNRVQIWGNEAELIKKENT